MIQGVFAIALFIQPISASAYNTTEMVSVDVAQPSPVVATGSIENKYDGQDINTLETVSYQNARISGADVSITQAISQNGIILTEQSSFTTW